MATTFKDICHGEKYERNGEEKMKWTKIGTLIEKDGKQYIKLQFVPVGAAEIFLSVFEPRQNDNQQSGQQKSSDPFRGMDDEPPF